VGSTEYRQLIAIDRRFCNIVTELQVNQGETENIGSDQGGKCRFGTLSTSAPSQHLSVPKPSSVV
jgi:hypothetical protein